MKFLLIVSALMAFASFAKADDAGQCALVNNQYTAACAPKLAASAETSPAVSLLTQAYEKQYKTLCTLLPDATTMTAADGASTGVIQYVCNDGSTIFTLQITGEATVKTDNSVAFTFHSVDVFFAE